MTLRADAPSKTRSTCFGVGTETMASEDSVDLQVDLVDLID